MPELLCYSDAKLGLQGTLYFVGFFLGCLLWLRLTDFLGRKWMTVSGLLLFLATLSVYLVKISALSIYLTLFFFGF